MIFHQLPPEAANYEIPQQFTYPFHYTPHPLCRMAAAEVQNYIQQQHQWAQELAKGKMFGVLIVNHPQMGLGYLAAFSGNIDGKNLHPFFVPPVFDILQEDGFFRIGERKLDEINKQLNDILKGAAYRNALKQKEDVEKRTNESLNTLRTAMKEAKNLRDQKRKSATLTPEEEATLIRESQFQKAEYKRQEKILKAETEQATTTLANIQQRIAQLKQERKMRSAELQTQIFHHFVMQNARGEKKDLCDIFSTTPALIPPGGSGECAAPKLLQYAFTHHLHPIAMAEFWWGASPKGEWRQHGHYYPSCQNKCAPILGFMLQGLDVESNPFENDPFAHTHIPIFWEDEHMAIVGKPAGMLTVPGKTGASSLYDILLKEHPEWQGPIIVHRLDMATSGLLVVAKNKHTHEAMQQRFAQRQVNKRYVALLHGTVKQNSGEINLPLRPDISCRPRQMVCHTYGKEAHTHYEVIKRSATHTLVHLWPHTGRTHQLRVHAAHPEGLQCHIVGDELYGEKDERLYLHAEEITFQHPFTGATIKVEWKMTQQWEKLLH